jgi:tRNA-modifying protein YgfZ
MRNFVSTCECDFIQAINPVSLCPMPNTYYSLAQHEFIRLSGVDSLRFLQGQVSCNTSLLSNTRSLTGALCNLKGRVIADFRLLQHEQYYLLQCSQGMAELVLATLAKYAVFSKLELTLLRQDDAALPAPTAIGLIGDAVDAALLQLGLTLPESPDQLMQNADCSVIRIPAAQKRVEIWFHTAQSLPIFLDSLHLAPAEDLQTWQRADLAAGIIHVTPALSEEYTPQLLNYDISGLIDFKKGCYTGQEIVARMFYRGTAKKRLYLASCQQAVTEQSRVISGNEEPPVSADESKSGNEILAFSNSESPSLLLAILATETVDAGASFQLSDQNRSELTIQSLPYGTQPA